MKNIFSAALLACASTGEMAHAFDGNRLYSECNTEDPGERIFCYGLISGMMSGLSASMQFAFLTRVENDDVAALDFEEQALGYCIPSGVTPEQLADIAVGYLGKNPSIRHIDGAYIMIYALREAFPCPPP